jgi:hypothetical protein
MSSNVNPPFPDESGGYPPPVPAPAFSTGTAISYGFEGFKRNAGLFILAILAIAAVNALVNWLRPDGFFGGLAWNLVSAAVSIAIGMAVVRAGLAVVDGRRVEVADLLRTDDLVGYIVAWLLVSVIVGVGFVLLIVPGLIAAFLLAFTSFAVLDRHEDPIGALKTSYRLTSGNVGEVLVLFLVLIALNFIGALLCGLGLFVTLPLSVIATAYAWRWFTNGPIAPL